IVARFIASDSTNEWAKVGVMIRAALEQRSVNAFIGWTPKHGIRFQSRQGTGEETLGTDGSRLTAPFWVKLVRRGAWLGGYTSVDCSSWTLVDWQILNMSTQVYVGLVVASHDVNAVCTAWFEQVQVSSNSGTGTDPQPLVGSGNGLAAEYFDNPS